MSRIEEERPEQTEFRVEATGGDIIYQWLRVNQQIAQSPFINLEGQSRPHLALGDLETNDSLLSGIHAHVSFLDEDFEGFKVETIFFPRTKLKAGIFSLLLGETAGIDESSEHEGKDIEMLAFHLSERLGEDYRFRRSDNAIRIVPSQEKLLNTTFLISQEDTPLGLAFCFRFEGNLDQGQEILEQGYQAYAGLLRDTTIAIYQKNKLPAPQRTFQLAPPKNLPPQIKQAEAQLNMQKRMMNPMGELADGEIREMMMVKELPEETFDDVGGAEDAVEELKLISYGLKNPETFKKWGTRLPRAVLLDGDPGTGKTLLARAAAHEAEANFYIVRLSDVLESLYGRTEKLIAGLFKDARENQPALIFIDELDALATHREYSTEITRHVVSILQQSLDGFEKAGDRVVVIAATNARNVIPEALLRAGRFMSIEVKKPDTPAREKIFRIHVNRAIKTAEREIFDPNVDLRALAQITQGLTGADLAKIVELALNQKVREQSRGLMPGPVTQEDLIHQVRNYDRNQGKKPLGFDPLREYKALN